MLRLRARAGLTLPEMLASALLIGALGVVDVITGHELSPSAFYVPVVGLVAWRGGKGAALWAVGASSAVGLIADHLLSDPVFSFSTSYTNAWVPWVNGLLRLTVYLIVGLSLSALRDAMREKDQGLIELRAALAEVRTLQGLLPICAWCKKIRNEQPPSEWVPIERYIAQRTDAEFTHGICPDCAKGLRAKG